MVNEIADREVLKNTPETELEQHDNSVTALVEDSDEEEEYKLPPPAPVAAPVVEKVVEKVETPVPVPVPVVAAEEPKKKAVARKVKPKDTA